MAMKADTFDLLESRGCIPAALGYQKEEPSTQGEHAHG